MELSKEGIQCQGYADDIVLIARGKFEDTLCGIINRGLNITSKWCSKAGLKINPAKTAVIPFTRKYKLPHLREINVGRATIPFQKEVKYLGVTMDSKLLWQKHVTETVNKCTKLLMTCRNIAGKSWGCKPQILRWLYTTVVQPSLTYGAVAWGGRVQLSTTKKQLSTLQRLACLTITGAMRTAPTAALEVLLELTPLHIVIEQSRTATLLRIPLEGPNGIMTANQAQELSKDLPILLVNRDITGKKYHFDRKFRTALSTKSDWISE